MSNVTPQVYGFLPQTEAYAAQVAKAGSYPSAKFLSNLDVLIRDLMRYNIWHQLDRMWIFANESQAAAKISIVNPINGSWPTSITAVNNPSFATMSGYTGNGSNSYLNTNFNASTQAVNYKLNSSTIGSYITTMQNPSGGSGKYDIGSSDASNGILLTQVLSTLTVKSFLFMNSNISTGDISSATGATAGLLTGVRASSTSLMIWNRGSLFANGSISSTAIPTQNFFLLANNNNGSAADFSTRTTAMAFMGGSFSQSTFYTIWQNFATKMGFNV